MFQVANLCNNAMMKKQHDKCVPHATCELYTAPAENTQDKSQVSNTVI